MSYYLEVNYLLYEFLFHRYEQRDSFLISTKRPGTAISLYCRWNLSRNGADESKCVSRHHVPSLPKQIQVDKRKFVALAWRVLVVVSTVPLRFLSFTLPSPLKVDSAVVLFLPPYVPDCVRVHPFTFRTQTRTRYAPQLSKWRREEMPGKHMLLQEK